MIIKIELTHAEERCLHDQLWCTMFLTGCLIRLVDFLKPNKLSDVMHYFISIAEVHPVLNEFQVKGGVSLHWDFLQHFTQYTYRVHCTLCVYTHEEHN